MPTLRYCIEIEYLTRYSSIIIKYCKSIYGGRSLSLIVIRWWSRTCLLERPTDYYHLHQNDWPPSLFEQFEEKILKWKLFFRSIHFRTSKLKINLSQNQQVQVDNEEPFRILIELRPDMAPKVSFRNFLSKSFSNQHMHQWKFQFLYSFADSSSYIFMSLLIYFNYSLHPDVRELFETMQGDAWRARIFGENIIWHNRIALFEIFAIIVQNNNFQRFQDIWC